MTTVAVSLETSSPCMAAEGPQSPRAAEEPQSRSARTVSPPNPPVPRAGIGGNGGVARKAAARAESLPGVFSHRLEDVDEAGVTLRPGRESRPAETARYMQTTPRPDGASAEKLRTCRRAVRAVVNSPRSGGRGKSALRQSLRSGKAAWPSEGANALGARVSRSECARPCS